MQRNFFDELRYAIYHNKTTNLDFKKFPCTSESLKLHIRRAYFQALEWNRAPFQSCHHLNHGLLYYIYLQYRSPCLNPLEYGYILEEGLYEPVIVNMTNIIPNDFPVPCSCGKCFRDRSCHCRFNGKSCSEFCDCSAKAPCNNPYNQ